MAICNDSAQHHKLREIITEYIANVWDSTLGSTSLPVWGMFVTSYLSHGGVPLPDGAALTRTQYYDTTGSIL